MVHTIRIHVWSYFEWCLFGFPKLYSNPTLIDDSCQMSKYPNYKDIKICNDISDYIFHDYINKLYDNPPENPFLSQTASHGCAPWSLAMPCWVARRKAKKLSFCGWSLRKNWGLTMNRWRLPGKPINNWCFVESWKTYIYIGFNHWYIVVTCFKQQTNRFYLQDCRSQAAEAENLKTTDCGHVSHATNQNWSIQFRTSTYFVLSCSFSLYMRYHDLSLQTVHLLFPTNLDDEDQENEEMRVNSAFPIRTRWCPLDS